MRGCEVASGSTQPAGVGGIGPRLEALAIVRRWDGASILRSELILFDREEASEYRFKLCVRVPGGGGPGGGPGSGMPGFQLLEDDDLRAGPSIGTDDPSAA